MFTAKDIQIKLIDSASAARIVKTFHYSGKVTQNSQIHFGVFLNGSLQGALQFGPSIDKRRMAQNLKIGFNEFLELNRMALSDACPKNSESRALGVCLRMLKKQYPHLKVVISFADACQCGDGTIYRASGFKLHSFKKNNSLLTTKDGAVVSTKSLHNDIGPAGKYVSASDIGATVLSGYQMKYLFFFDKALEKTFSFVPFDKIPANVRMYKGQRASSKDSVATGFHPVEGCANQTDALHLKETDEKG